MAVDQLKLYNNALLIIGQRELASLTEDREPRYLLDASWNLDAVEYCLEIIKPVFASKDVALSSPATSSVHGLDSVHTLPTDYITVIEVYSDNKLDQPITRYLIEGNTLVCEYDTVYLRYVSNDHVTSFTNWSASFTRVVSSYLAREICLKLTPKRYDEINDLFIDRIEAVKGLEAEKEPGQRSSVTTVTLTNDWRQIYNDALLIMGLDEITTNTDDSNRRTKLDRALDAGIVSETLEDTGWTFALTSTKIQYDPSVEPEWGYQRAHGKPVDIHRIVGLFHDEYMSQPLKAYIDEGSYFFNDQDEFFLQYISTDWLVNPSSWPTFFKRLVAARLAKDAAPSLRGEGADLENAKEVFEDRESSAKSNDAMSSPPRKLANGNWSSALFRGGYRGRP